MADAVSASGVALDNISLTEMKQRVRLAVPDVAARLAKAVMETVPDDIVRALSRHIHGDLHSRLASQSLAGVGATGYSGEPTIQLWPSEVGAYVGQDSWRTRDHALADVWERTNPAAFRAERAAWLARGRTRRRPGMQAIHAAANQSMDPYPNIRTADAVARFCTTATPQDMLKLFKTKGQVLEEETAGLVAERFGQPLSLRNTGSTWRPSSVGGAVPTVTVARPRPPGDITDPGPYVFSGAVDGWLTEEPYKDVVVELKLRMRVIPPTVPLRDILQVQTYLAMHGVQRAAHVQRVIGTSDVVITMIERDADLWNDTVMPDVQRFVCDVRRLLRGGEEDEAIRHRVLYASEKTALPLAQLPAAMASELRAADAKTTVTVTAQQTTSISHGTHLDVLTVNHHMTDVVAFKQLAEPADTSLPSPTVANTKKRRRHADDDVVRLPTMRQPTPSQQLRSRQHNPKRVVVAALRDMLSLSSRVKRVPRSGQASGQATAPARPYNTRSRSR